MDDDNECFQRGRFDYRSTYCDARMWKNFKKKQQLCEKPRIVKGIVDTLKNIKEDDALLKDTTYLTFKNIKRGMLCFGIIIAVESKKLFINLPNSLQGEVTLASVKSMYGNAIQSAPSLPHLFQVDQIVVCSLLNFDNETKQIELSLDPKDVNSKYKIRNMKAGMLISGWIKSIGSDIAVDVGMTGVQAYVLAGTPEFKKKIKKKEIQVNRLMRFAIHHVDFSKKTLYLSFNLWLSSDMKPKDINDMYPGMIVDFNPTMEVFGGYNGKVGDLNACVSRLHMPEEEVQAYIQSLTKIKLEDRLSFVRRQTVDRKMDSKAKACVLYVSSDGVVVVSYHWKPALEVKLSRLDLEQNLTEQIRSATVIEYVPGLGFICLVSACSRFGILPHTCKSEVTATGMKLPVTIVNHSPFDGVLSLTAPNVDYALQLFNCNVSCGEIVHAKVVKLTSVGVKVMLGAWKDDRFECFNLLAFIPRAHVSEKSVKNLKDFIAPGDILRCRVLSVNLELNMTALTMKKGLMDTKAPIVTSAEQLKRNMLLYVFVKEKIFPNKFVVGHFNDIVGELYSRVAHGLVLVGQVILAYVLHLPSKNQPLLFGLNRPEIEVIMQKRDEPITGVSLPIAGANPLDPDEGGNSASNEVSCGQVVQAKLLNVTKESLIALLGFQKDNEFISLNLLGVITQLHMDDHHVFEPEEQFALGDILNCRVLSFDSGLDVSDVCLTNKQTLVESNHPIITEYEQLEVDMVVDVYISEIESPDIIVSFYNNKTGKISLNDLPPNILKHLRPGLVVVASVKSCTPDAVTMTMHPESIQRFCANESLTGLSQDLPGEETSSNEKPSATNPEDAGRPRKSLLSKCGNVVRVQVKERLKEGLMVSVVGSTHQFVLPVYHLSDFMSIANAKHTLSKQETIFAARLLSSDPLVVTLKENMTFNVDRKELLKLSPGDYVPGYIIGSYSYGVVIEIPNGGKGDCSKKDYGCWNLPEASAHFRVGQSVIAKVVKYQKKFTAKNKFSLKNPVGWKSRVEQYFAAYHGMIALVPQDLKVDIGDTVNVESASNEAAKGGMVVTEGKAAGYSGVFMNEKESNTGPAVVVYVDHSTKQLWLTNSGVVLKFAQKDEVAELEREAVCQCVVLYMNCDVTVAYIRDGGPSKGRLVCLASFPRENPMFEVEKPDHWLGKRVQVSILEPIWKHSKVLMCCGVSPSGKRRFQVPFKRQREDLAEISPKKIKAEKVDVSTVRSKEEWEDAVRAHPKNSDVWIHYIAFLISSNRVDEARKVGERAVGSPTPRTEKMKIWVTLLNLENLCGNDVTMEKTLRSALDENDQVEILQHLIKIYKQSGKYYKALKVHSNLVGQAADKNRLKFDDIHELWMGHIQHLQETCNHPNIAKLVAKCRKTKNSSALMKIRKKVAKIEFESGNVERGIEIYENILTNPPFLYCSWVEYTQLLVDAGRVEDARNLFRRGLLKLTSGERASFRKRFTELETAHDDIECSVKE